MAKLVYLALIAVLITSLVTGLSASALTTVYNIQGRTVSQSMGSSVLPFSGSNLASITAEHFTSSSNMVGLSIVRMDIPILKLFTSTAGHTKLNGQIFAGVFDSDGNTIRQFGTFKAKDINDVGHVQLVNFTISPTYTIQAGDNIGIRYSQPQTNEEGFLKVMTDDLVDFEGEASYFVLKVDNGPLQQNATGQFDLAMTLYTN
jgi:hypothetical protein